MRTVAYGLLAVGTLLWFAPFLLVKRNSEAPQKLNPRARWGILLVVAYSLLWQNSFWARRLSAGRIAISTIFLALAALLSWTGASALGRHGRLDAGLSKNHKLVRTEPRSPGRYPTYTSMLCLLLGTGF
jgi:protein-S-isoprenylcysteine O-methyltransferase Ste14